MAMQSAEEEWKALVEAIEKYTDIDFSKTTQEIEKIQEAMANYKLGELKKLPGFIDGLKASFQSTEGPIRNMEEALGDAGDTVKEFDRAAQDVENLKNQVLDFFSISNTIQLFKRALQSALETVKELDAVMTETAVVTDFSIGDMWEKLPQYAKQATKLGTSIASLYEATTLYYQQGLQTNEAMGVGIETMKMARIANMDATDATTAMTAALRGFNMEVNEMNAQRVNDVYSELAAITAADTSQIATAMGKTASIAASANMEFETTAAFLAQIIETTQEAPETAGTAMKTIIARFTEVKELFSEGMLTGEDEEGEEININKIDAALRSVGISLKDFLNGSRGIDEIFLELASKWDSLDLATQRYIATAAAGSRQQSRFLAMMSNYDRTMELVIAANNSAGASQEQFAKTTDSLDAKLQRLKNAWDTFVMGLANDEFLKGAVDALTFLVEQLNNLINLLSNGEGTQKSLLSLVATFGALKTGGALFNSLFEGVKEAAKSSGASGADAFGKAFKTSLGKNFGKIDGYIKSFLPNKKDWKELQNQSFANIDVEKWFGKNPSKYVTDSLIKDYQNAFNEIKGLSEESRQEIFSKASNLFDTGKSTEAIKVLNNALGENAEKFKISEETARRATNTMEQGFGKAAAAAMVAAGAFNIVSDILEDGGHERGAEGFTALANGASMAASALMVLPGILKTIGVASTKIPVIGKYIAIGIAAISLISAISKWHESAEEKMERLQKEADAAADAAQKAKESYDALFSTKNEYNDMQKGLEDLIKGTDEWRKKLVEANQQVLQLLDTYPELAKYVERGEDGQLAIGEAGWKALESQLEQQVTNTQAMSAMANIIVSDEERENKQDKFNQLFYKYNETTGEHEFDVKREKALLDNAELLVGASRERVFSHEVEGLSLETKKQLWETLGLEGEYIETEDNLQTLISNVGLNGSVDLYNENLLKLSEATGITAEELYNYANDILEYNSFMEKEGAITESNLATFLGSSEIASNSKYGDQIARGIAKQSAWNIDDKIEEKAKEINKENKTELEEQYKTLTGKEAEGMSETDLANAIAKIEIGKELSGQVDTIIQQLDSMGKDSPDAKRIAALISGDFSDFTRNDNAPVHLTDDDKKALAKAYGKETFKELAESQGYSEEEYEQYLLENWQDLISKFDELTTEGLEKVFEAEWDTKDDSVMQNATYNQEKAYTDLIAQILGQQGIEGAKSFVKTFDGILQDESTRSQILNALNTYDFKREGAAEDFISYLQEIGVTIPDNEIKEFTADLKALSTAFRKFDLKTVSEEVKSALDFADDLESRDDSKGFTDEEKETLIRYGKADAKDFVWTGQEWTYLGSSMDSLSEVIKDNTAAILEDKRKGLQEQIKTGEVVEGKVEDGKVSYETGEYGWLAEGGWGKIQKTFTIAEFLGGKDSGITKADIEGVLGQTFLTEEEAWAAFDKYKFAYENLAANRATDAAWDVRYGSVADMQKNAQDFGFDKIGNGEVAVNYTKEQQDALAALAKQYGVSQTAIDNFTDAMKGNNDEEKEAAAMALRNLVSQKQLEKQYGQTLKKVQEVNKEYGNITKDMPEYEEAVLQYTEALGLDTTDETNLDYIRENMELVRSAAEGNIESIQRMNAELAGEHGLIITADGNFDGYNEAVDLADENVQKFIQDQIKAGAFELETIEAKQDVKYLVPTKNGFEFKTFETGQVIQVVKPVDAPTIANSLTQAGSSSGGGGGSSKKWENPYDEFYNTVAKINEELRKREMLERKYQRLLNQNIASARELADLAHSQIASLEIELADRERIKAGRERQMAEIQSEYSDVGKYAWYDETKGQIKIDWELLEKLNDSSDEELTSRIEEYISKLEKQEELIEEEIDKIEEIQDTVWEIEQQGKDEYLDLETQIKEAIIAGRQAEIDKLSEINETINNADASIIDAMQKSIEKQRQDRENQETEDELAKKQRRLLYLQQDTSGANAMEILKLQDEIEKGQQDYTDRLIDQKISALQEQNDAAAKQREKQIEIAQAQLDRYAGSKEIWMKVQELMTEGLDKDKGLLRGSTLASLLKDAANFEGLSYLESLDWWKDMDKMVAKALQYLELGRQLENIGIEEGTQVEFYDIQNGQTLTGTVDKEGNVITADGIVYDNVYQGGDGNYYAGENRKKPDVEEDDSEHSNPQGPSQPGTQLNGYTTQIPTHAGYKEIRISVEDYEALMNPSMREERWSDLLAKYYEGGTIEAFKEAFLRNLQPYKTGGLADFTGPAWLDGTKARPEIVLDAQDSRNFIQLRDILGSLLNRSTANASTENNGDITYDIDINVEKIDNDYDLEQVAIKVKSLITDNARYRNNNAVGLKR